jgi:beta-glucosidase
VLAADPAGVLPLDRTQLSSVALLGALAREARVLGGGSAIVFPEHVVSPLEGLTAALPDSVKLSYAVGADPRTDKVAPAAQPHWADLQATFRDSDGGVLHQTPIATGAGRWMELPDGVTPEDLAAVEISGRLTARTGGEHLLGIRGVGDFTLTAAGDAVFAGTLTPDSEDIGAFFLHPAQEYVPLPLTDGASVDVSLIQQVRVDPDAPVVAFTLGYSEPVVDPDVLLAEAEAVAASSDVAIVVVGTTEKVESEGFDRTTLALPGRQDELVRRVAEVNARTIVVVNAGSPVEMPWADDVAAVLLAWFPGQEAGHAIADVLLGASEPGGRLPTTWPAAQADCPVLNVTPVDGVLSYDEGVFIGYRAWERAGTPPRYQFGHGLGYTTWAYDDIAVDGRRVRLTVRNTGSRAGREVVQVYVAPVTPDAQRPVRWLAGFGAIIAEPGATGTVEVELPERAFQVWDGGWRTVTGQYTIEAAHSVGDVRASAPLTID